MARQENIENLTTAEWKLAEEFSTVLKPVAEATEIASGEKYPTRSLVIPLIIGITTILSTFISTPTNRNCGIMFARQLKKAFTDRFTNFKQVVPDCLCTILDPRFRGLFFDTETVDFAVEQLKSFADDMVSRARDNTINRLGCGLGDNPSGGVSGSGPSGSGIRITNPSAVSSVTSSIWDSIDKQICAEQRSRQQRDQTIHDLVQSEIAAFLAKNTI